MPWEPVGEPFPFEETPAAPPEVPPAAPEFNQPPQPQGPGMFAQDMPPPAAAPGAGTPAVQPEPAAPATAPAPAPAQPERIVAPRAPAQPPPPKSGPGVAARGLNWAPVGEPFAYEPPAASQADVRKSEPQSKYGLREDGTPKGEGYFGTIPRKDGTKGVSGELSIGVEWGGKEHLIPSMVPTLDRKELDYLLSGGNPFDKDNPVARSIVDKAVAHAQQREAQGRSVWAEPNEKHPQPPAAELSNKRGVRNNNPGNLIATGNPWAGEVEGKDKKFAMFDTPESGIAALAKQLKIYDDRHNVNTVRAIVKRWAPASDNNDVEAYVAAMTKSMGVEPNEPLDMSDPETLRKATVAIIEHENGGNPYADDVINAGVSTALGLPAKSPAPTVAPAPVAAPVPKPPPAPAAETVQGAMPAQTSPEQRERNQAIARDYLSKKLTPLGVGEAVVEGLTDFVASAPAAVSAMMAAIEQGDRDAYAQAFHEAKKNWVQHPRTQEGKYAAGVIGQVLGMFGKVGDWLNGLNQTSVTEPETGRELQAVTPEYRSPDPLTATIIQTLTQGLPVLYGLKGIGKGKTATEEAPIEVEAPTVEVTARAPKAIEPWQRLEPSMQGAGPTPAQVYGSGRVEPSVDPARTSRSSLGTEPDIGLPRSPEPPTPAPAAPAPQPGTAEPWRWPKSPPETPPSGPWQAPKSEPAAPESTAPPDGFTVEYRDGEVVARDARGNQVGSMAAETGAHPYSSTTHVDPQWQRRGVASAMYDEWERQTGQKLAPSRGDVSEDAMRFWLRRDPEAMAENLRQKLDSWANERDLSGHDKVYVEKLRARLAEAEQAMRKKATAPVESPDASITVPQQGRVQIDEVGGEPRATVLPDDAAMFQLERQEPSPPRPTPTRPAPVRNEPLDLQPQIDLPESPPWMEPKPSAQPAPQPTAPLAKGALDDPRLLQDEHRTALQAMVHESGWAETGGRLLRDVDGNVVDRTRWLPHAEWYRRMQQERDTRLPGGKRGVDNAVRKALAGEKMTPGERRAVKFMLDEHDAVLKYHNQVRKIDPDVDPFDMKNAADDVNMPWTETSIIDLAKVNRARQIDPDAVERIGDNLDDAQYMREIEKINAQSKTQEGAGSGQSDASQAAGAAGEAANDATAGTAAQSESGAAGAPSAPSNILVFDPIKGTVKKKSVGGKQPPADPNSVVGEKFHKFINRVAERQFRESEGQYILDGLEDRGVTPKSVSDTFWNQTFPSLPPAVKKRFTQYMRNETGLEPGSALTHNAATGETVTARDWQHIASEMDWPESVTGLEGTERGLVVMMDEANRTLRSVGGAKSFPQKLSAGKAMMYKGERVVVGKYLGDELYNVVGDSGKIYKDVWEKDMKPFSGPKKR